MEDQGISFTNEEVEHERQIEIEHTKDRIGKPLDEIEACYVSDLGTHEALHAAYMVTDMVSQFLLEHPAVVLDEVAWKHAHAAHTALFNLYQHMGRIQGDIRDKRDEQINQALLKL